MDKNCWMPAMTGKGTEPKLFARVTARLSALFVLIIILAAACAAGPVAAQDQPESLSPAPMASGTRVALVIGNSDYIAVPDLKNPHNDASAIAATLQRLRFDVTLGLDLDAIGLRKHIQKFVQKLDENTVAVFFYAGHGMQVNGTNYLVPVDASLAKMSDLEFEAVSFELLLSPMEATAGLLFRHVIAA